MPMLLLKIEPYGLVNFLEGGFPQQALCCAIRGWFPKAATLCLSKPRVRSSTAHWHHLLSLFLSEQEEHFKPQMLTRVKSWL